MTERLGGSRRRRNAKSTFPWVLVVVSLTARTGFGQNVSPEGAPSSTALQEGRTRFSRGVQFVKDGDFQAGLVEFRRAYEVAPNYRVLYNIGQTYIELQNYAQALQTFERYLRDGGKEIPADRQQFVSKEIEILQSKVGSVTIKVNRDQAEVFLDDVAVGKTPFSEPLLVNVGRHKISASLAGTLDATRYLEIASGDRSEVSLMLNDVSPVAPKSSSAPFSARPSLIGNRSTLPAHRGFTPVVGGLGALGVIAFSTFAFLSISGVQDRNQLRDGCAPRCNPDDVEAAQRKLLMGDVFFGVGAIALGAAAFVFFSRPASTGTEAKTGSFQIFPVAGGAVGAVGKVF